ncbi:hypothetical protein NUH87_01970 [Pseudomonas batumici]
MPPWGTTGCLAALQMRRALATCAVVRGNSSAAGQAGAWPVQSL